MTELLEAAQIAQAVLDDLGLPNCLIGGIAVLRWGEPRLTVDADLSVFVGFGGEAKVAEAILSRLRPRIPDAVAFAARHRVVLAQVDTVAIDIALAAFPFERDLIDRATELEFRPGIRLRTCTAEDLLVLKAFANRPRDWQDIEGIVARQNMLDRRLLWPLLDELAEVRGDQSISLRVAALLRDKP